MPIAAPPSPLVFVANGSGGGFELTNGLAKAAARSGMNICVDTIIWSRFQSAPRDHADRVGHLAGAQKLSSKILAVRAQQPGRRIYVAAFSSGTHVALEAMRTLPPDSVDRIFLFGASVAFFYDLAPALRASREGIDAFYSDQDGVLETAVSVIGTADGYPAPAAGRIGFWLPSKGCPAYPLYQQKLRQYPWQPAMALVGHHGHHLDWTGYGFLQAYVVPMLLPGAVDATAPVVIGH